MYNNAFRDCQDTERRSLEILRPFIMQRTFGGQYVLIEKGRLAKEMQAVYGDVLFNDKKGRIQSVEIKAEENNSENLFIETWSNRSRWNLGWLYKLNVDFILYHFMNSDTLYTMHFPELRNWLFTHESGDRPQISAYPQKVQKRHIQMNDTWGAIIPVSHIRVGVKSFKRFRATTGIAIDGHPCPSIIGDNQYEQIGLL